MTLTAAAPRFSYQARDQRGQVVNGYVSAGTLADATKLLRAEGKYIVDIKPAKAKGPPWKIRPRQTWPLPSESAPASSARN